MFAGPGLVDFGIDLTVKFGGSLLTEVAPARVLAAALVAASRRRRLAVIPGGGPTDLLIEAIATEAGLPDEVINPACMRAMDQTGILLAGLAPEMIPVDTLAGLRAALARDLVPVLLPSSLILSLDVFTRESVITSDTLAAYLAFLLGSTEYLVLTDVDGVYRDFGADGHGELLAECTTSELIALGATSVDRCLAPLLDAVEMPAWILNGNHPERLAELAAGGRPIGTRITVS
jgi:aspartokinase-like uncharacterized kinase